MWIFASGAKRLPGTARLIYRGLKDFFCFSSDYISLHQKANRIGDFVKINTYRYIVI